MSRSVPGGGQGAAPVIARRPRAQPCRRSPSRWPGGAARAASRRLAIARRPAQRGISRRPGRREAARRSRSLPALGRAGARRRDGPALRIRRPGRGPAMVARHGAAPARPGAARHEGRRGSRGRARATHRAIQAASGEHAGRRAPDGGGQLSALTLPHNGYALLWCAIDLKGEREYASECSRAKSERAQGRISPLRGVRSSNYD